MASPLPRQITLRGKPVVMACYMVSAIPEHVGVSDTLTGRHSILWFDYSCRWEVNGHPVDLHPGDCLVLPLHAHVRCMAIPRGGDHIFVTFRMTTVRREPALVLPFLSRMGERFDGYWKDAQCVVEEFYYGHRRRHQEAAAILFHRMLLHLADDALACPDGAQLPTRRADKAVREIANWITLHQPAAIDIARLAREHSLSPDHLNRRFLHVHGVSLKRFHQEHRFRKCLHLLHAGTLPLKEIARMCGFHDSHHFNKAIRERFGKSPTAIRNQTAMA